MKLTEVFEKAGIDGDEKARRIVNTSRKVARITASEIEAGITLERLETIGVPVFRYTTQITIHGQLPDFSTAARQAGYKAVFRNANGSVGVRYVAIDAQKKEQIVRASRAHLRDSRNWCASLNSQGLTVYHYFEVKDDCVAAFKAFPRELICGGITAGASAVGGFYVIANVGAIPEENLWPFIHKLWNVASQGDLDAIEAAKRAEYAALEAKRRQEADAEAVALAARREEFRRTVILRPLDALPVRNGEFVRIARDFSRGQAFRLELVTFAKRGPTLCVAAQHYPANGPIVGRFRKLESFRLARFQEQLRAGELFAAV